jgi:hypothetical protein
MLMFYVLLLLETYRRALDKLFKSAISASAIKERQGTQIPWCRILQKPVVAQELFRLSWDHSFIIVFTGALISVDPRLIVL